MKPVVQHGLGSVHPNVISLIALAFGLLAAAVVTQQMYAIGLVLWLINRILDGIDGLAARVHGKQSDFGGYLDLLLDFIVYLTFPIAFVVAEPSTVKLWALVGLLSIYVLNTLSWTVLSALLEKRQQQSQRQTSVEMPTGLIEGAETIVFYVLFCLLPGQIAVLFSVMAVLVLVTASQRIAWAYRYLN